MEIKETCSDLAGSQSGELFYRCMAEFKDHTHWAGPFFSALFLGFLAGVLIATITGVTMSKPSSGEKMMDWVIAVGFAFCMVMLVIAVINSV